MRVEFFGGWLTKGQPACFNLPAFFFQQGFMAGILQMHARKYGLPIDTLQFSYAIQKAENASGPRRPRLASTATASSSSARGGTARR